MTEDENPDANGQSSLEDFFSGEGASPDEIETTTEETIEYDTESKADSSNASSNKNPAANEIIEEEEILDVHVGKTGSPDNLPPSFLLSVDYSGTHNKAIARLYRPDTKEVFFWIDNTGHKPYCYTDWPPQAVKSVVGRHQGFVGTETVELHDLLRDEPVKMTKVIGNNPLAIGGRPDSIRNSLSDSSTGVNHTWESAIRYQLCYTYDNNLVPGLMYKIENGNLQPVSPDVDAKVLKDFEKVIIDDKDLQSIIEEYSPMFFTEVPDIWRIAIDIEVYTPVANRVPDTRTADYPVTAIGLSDNEGYNKCFILKREGHSAGKKSKDFPSELEIVYFDDEAEMLVEAFKIIDQYPIVLTFVGDTFDLKYLHNRAKRLRIDMDTYCPITLRGNQDPRRERALLTRGVHVDFYKFFTNPSIKIYALSGAYQRENLDSIAEGILGSKKLELSTDISNLGYYELAHYCWLDSNLVMQFTQFESNLLLRLIILLMRISRMSMDDVTRFFISSWIQSLFRQEHRSNKLLIPRRIDIDSVKQADAQTEATIDGKAFKGAIVINPVAGVHFNATVLDFASLYPTIMKTHNISYETVDCPHEECRTGTHNQVPETEHWTCT
ncbi:MAG: 3'-5' exonuclease, partial [Candidatus Thorarchaeota archaeon]